MGLDSVDIVVRIEKAFDISFPDSETEAASTVGKVHDLVWKYVDTPSKKLRCLSQVTFYKTRKSISSSYGIPKKQIVPDTLLEEVIPLGDRYKKWKQLSGTLGYKLPSLKFAGLLEIIEGVFVWFYTIGILTLIVSFFTKIPSIPVLLFVLVFMLAGLLFDKVFQTRKTRIVVKDVRALVGMMMELNFKDLKLEGLTISRKEVEIIVNNIISDVGGIDLQEITPEKSIGKDLGIS